MPQGWNWTLDWAGQGFYWFWRDMVKTAPKYDNDWKWSYWGAEGAD